MTNNKIPCIFQIFQVITDAICDFLRRNGLDVQNMVGLGTDGASVLCGCKNSVLTKLKEMNPSLIGVRYVFCILKYCYMLK